MDRVMLAWNLPNWITVVLMAAAGYVLLGLIAQVFKGGGLGIATGSGQTAAGF